MDRNPGESQSSYPEARTAHLVITETGPDLLVYDQERHHLHHLNPSAAAIWHLCDGQRTVSDLAQAASIDEDAVRLALRKLEDATLLDGPLTVEMRGTVQSRRRFVQKASIAAIPAIVSITAPIAKAAASGPRPTSCQNYECTTDEDCCERHVCDHYFQTCDNA